jgi:membrane protein YqaA with SNARE-associated domain
VIAVVLAAVAVGVVSALLPVVNAEAFHAGATLLQPRSAVVACTIALAVGQTIGKLIIFTASRRGATRWRSAHAGRRSRSPKWVRRASARLMSWLSHPRGGPAAVAISAGTGLPPLALVSAAAGASTIRCCAFSVACFAGRLLRFATLAGGVAALAA